MYKGNKQAGLWIDRLALIIIGSASIAYSIFLRKFAELHINFVFLNFPVFVGEILVFLCLILFFLIWRPHKINRGHILFIAYFIFILSKVAYGYVVRGPLALRHAALFYYPIFVIFGYSFFDKDIFNRKKILILAIIAALAWFYYIFQVGPYLMTYFLLAIIVIKACTYKIVRRLLFLSLIIAIYASVVFMRQNIFYSIARMELIADLVAMLCIAIMFFIALKVRLAVKLIALTIAVLFVIVAMLTMCHTNIVRSIFDIRIVTKMYKAYNALINAERGKYKLKEYKPKLYNPGSYNYGPGYKPGEIPIDPTEEVVVLDEHKTKKSLTLGQISQDNFKKEPSTQPSVQMNKATAAKGTEDGIGESRTRRVKAVRDKVEKEVAAEEEMQSNGIPTGTKVMLADNKLIYIRPLSQSCSQNLFRIFIWRDMLVQIWEGRPWSFFIGFDFGKPLRSISIEILDWAGGDWKIEWGGCGWITAHNSFLYMIYMGGIVGLLSVGIVLSIWVRMCAVSVKRKNTTAILLCGILVYWITSVFFGVILELPYYAIPFWSLFGMTYAYIFKR